MAYFWEEPPSFDQDDHSCLDADLGASGPSGGRTLVTAPDSFCLDAEAGSSGKDGQPVQGFGCAGGTNQVYLVSVSHGSASVSADDVAHRPSGLQATASVTAAGSCCGTPAGAR
ncbi:hypothetical protein [Streptomyces sp. NPDC090798]|uniref:hypothetical protein n=1 Tax=Streptomyces sp. NPDC090798 TaxID=3365968 RepID=UPI00380FB5DC